MILGFDEMSKRDRQKSTSNVGTGIRFYYHHKCSCDIREMDISPCMGAERNTNASNDNPLIIWKRKNKRCS